MKVISWLGILAGIVLILAGIVYSCEPQGVLERDLEVSGQVAKVCAYRFDGDYDPALNPIDNQMDNYGQSFKDFCVWFKVANKSKDALLFDSIKTVWLFGSDFFAANLAAVGGRKFVIPPGGNYLFSFSTDNNARKFFDRYGCETVSFCFELVAINSDASDQVKIYGPFASNNFLPLVNLPTCETKEVGVKLADIKYLPLKFFLAADDFISSSLKEYQKNK